MRVKVNKTKEKTKKRMCSDHQAHFLSSSIHLIKVSGLKPEKWPYLLVVELLGLPRLEELQQVSECSLIVVSERIPWTIPVPGHHTTRQGGRTTTGRRRDPAERNHVEMCGEVQGGEDRRQPEREGEEENKKTGAGGQVTKYFL